MPDSADNSPDIGNREGMPVLKSEEFAVRRQSLKKMAKFVAVTSPAVLGLLQSKRALAASGE